MSDQSTGYVAVGWAAEDSYGTEQAVTQWYKTTGQGPKVQPQWLEIIDESIRPGWEGLPHEIHPSHCDVDIPMYLLGKSGAAGSAAVQAELLEACGWVETLVGGTSAIYTLAAVFQDDTTNKGITVIENRWQSDAQYRSYKALGVRGKTMIVWEHGKFLTLQLAAGKGLFVEPSDPQAGAIPGSWDGGKSSISFSGSTVTVGGTVIKVKKITFDSALEVVESRSASGGADLDSVRLHRAPGGAATYSFEFESVEAFQLFLAAFKNKSTQALVIESSNGTDTVRFEDTIQLQKYTRSGGANSGFAFPARSIATPTLTMT